MARLVKDNDIPHGTTRVGNCSAARRAIVEQFLEERNGPANYFSPIFDRQIDCGIDRSHIFIPIVPADDRFDDRIDLRTNRSGRPPAFLPLPPVSLLLFLLLFSSRSLLELSFAADERPTPLLLDLYARFLLLLLPFLRSGPDYMIIHLPFSAQGLFFLSGACISGSFFSFSSTYSRILPRRRIRGSSHTSVSRNTEIATWQHALLL